MVVFGQFEYIVTALDFLLFSTFGRGHLLGEVAVFSVFELHLDLVLGEGRRRVCLEIAVLTLLVRVGRFLLAAL